MTHHSRLAGFIIDCENTELGEAAQFWGAALGLPIRDPNEDGADRYAVLDADALGLHIEVQVVEHPSRVHLDIETDDIEAEASRLEQLGAQRVALVHNRWWVMQAPSGHRFCVVPMRHPERGAAASRWE